MLSWKLCKGTKFSSTENVLQLVKDRLDNQGQKPTIFFIDNCCSWGEKLLKIFPDMSIKLDPFHAIQSVIKKIPKKKGCNEAITQPRRKMMLSLKQLFQDPNDKGEQRTMDTPSPEVILENIDIFMNQWSKAEIYSIPLLPSAVVKEIGNLKKHVIKGCLSGIPPSGGTNRNEANIHRSLSKSLKRSRIGLELALAFLELFFYKLYEKKISCKLSNKRQKINHIKPVEMCGGMGEDFKTNEQFGGPLTFQENAAVADCEFAETFSEMEEAINCINYLLKEHSDTSSDKGHSSSDDQNGDTSDAEDCVDFLHNEDIVNVIHQAANFTV